ncbi:hypothetical protein [Nocardioides pacificus]
MRINLANVVAPAFVVLILAFVALGNCSGPETSEGPTLGPRNGGAADRYLDDVAIELARPGVYVDPAVIEANDLSAAEAAELDDAAADTAGPVRIAVLPAESLVIDNPVEWANQEDNLVYPPEELVAQVYDRVGVDGTYAVLVAADSPESSRSFTAYQFAEERPFFQVEDALDSAVDCCAPVYAPMLERFIAEAGEEEANLWAWAAWIGGAGAAGAGGYGGLRWWRRRRTQQQADAAIADAWREPLNEEVIELSATISALPPAPADSDEARRSRTILDLIEGARQRLDTLATSADVEGVVTRLADARYELTVLDALRHGRPVPPRTPPCFFDPRHGPSVDTHAFTPSRGTEREVPVCVDCRAQVEAKRIPTTRTVRIDGDRRFYWDLGRASRPYLNGYWQRDRFADPAAERVRRADDKDFRSSSPTAAPTAPKQRKTVSFVWESGSSGSGSSGSGSSGRGSTSSRRRSSGGGSSRRSSRRSGGSRRF